MAEPVPLATTVTVKNNHIEYEITTFNITESSTDDEKNTLKQQIADDFKEKIVKLYKNNIFFIYIGESYNSSVNSILHDFPDIIFIKIKINTELEEIYNEYLHGIYALLKITRIGKLYLLTIITISDNLDITNYYQTIIQKTSKLIKERINIEMEKIQNKTLPPPPPPPPPEAAPATAIPLGTATATTGAPAPTALPAPPPAPAPEAAPAPPPESSPSPPPPPKGAETLNLRTNVIKTANDNHIEYQITDFNITESSTKDEKSTLRQQIVDDFIQKVVNNYKTKILFIYIIYSGYTNYNNIISDLVTKSTEIIFIKIEINQYLIDKYENYILGLLKKINKTIKDDTQIIYPIISICSIVLTSNKDSPHFYLQHFTDKFKSDSEIRTLVMPYVTMMEAAKPSTPKPKPAPVPPATTVTVKNNHIEYEITTFNITESSTDDEKNTLKQQIADDFKEKIVKLYKNNILFIYIGESYNSSVNSILHDFSDIIFIKIKINTELEEIYNEYLHGIYALLGIINEVDLYLLTIIKISDELVIKKYHDTTTEKNQLQIIQIINIIKTIIATENAASAPAPQPATPVPATTTTTPPGKAPAPAPTTPPKPAPAPQPATPVPATTTTTPPAPGTAPGTAKPEQAPAPLTPELVATTPAPPPAPPALTEEEIATTLQNLFKSDLFKTNNYTRIFNLLNKNNIKTPLILVSSPESSPKSKPNPEPESKLNPDPNEPLNKPTRVPYDDPKNQALIIDDVSLNKEEIIKSIHNENILNTINDNTVILDPAGLDFMQKSPLEGGGLSGQIYKLLVDNKNPFINFYKDKTYETLYDEDPLDLAKFMQYNITGKTLNIIHSIGPDFNLETYSYLLKDITLLDNVFLKIYKNILNVFLDNFKANNQLKLCVLSGKIFANGNQPIILLCIAKIYIILWLKLKEIYPSTYKNMISIWILELDTNNIPEAKQNDYDYFIKCVKNYLGI
jgi:hypothetical protein